MFKFGYSLALFGLLLTTGCGKKCKSPFKDMKLPMYDKAKVLAAHARGCSFAIKTAIDEKTLVKQYVRAISRAGWKVVKVDVDGASTGAGVDAIFKKGGKKLKLDVTTGMADGTNIQLNIK